MASQYLILKTHKDPHLNTFLLSETRSLSVQHTVTLCAALHLTINRATCSVVIMREKCLFGMPELQAKKSAVQPSGSWKRTAQNCVQCAGFRTAECYFKPAKAVMSPHSTLVLRRIWVNFKHTTTSWWVVLSWKVESCAHSEKTGVCVFGAYTIRKIDIWVNFGCV